MMAFISFGVKFDLIKQDPSELGRVMLFEALPEHWRQALSHRVRVH